MQSTPFPTWWRMVRWPSFAFAMLAPVFATTDLDLTIAKSLFFDVVQGQWLGAHSWWIGAFLHTGGRWAIRVIVACACVLWIATYCNEGARALRRPAGYFIVASVLGIAIVGLLKTITNVDCPWDLTPFGGHFPVVSLFADRPDALRAGRCFPAAHASSGYALVALYFVFRERSRVLARIGLGVGVVCGVVFGLAQQARGAHFMSHDLWSAYLVWVIAASIYVFGFATRLYGTNSSKTADGTVDLARTPPVPAVSYDMG
jgi:membrane-associated PAP2 superfamily phosphatase